MRRLPWPLLIVVAVVAFLVAPGRDKPAGPGANETAHVVRIVDGDTIKVQVAGRSDTVRYIGIDTPESVKPGTPVQCFAHAASAANARLVAGRTVRLEVGAEPRDRYGRLLAYVYRAGDGTSVNARLLTAGYARTLTIPPNDRLASRFAALQEAARRERRGLWRVCSVR
jgi:micrococcal nuclease